MAEDNVGQLELEAAIRNFLVLDQGYPKIKEYLNSLTEAKNEVVRLGGVGYHFQDPVSGRVFETSEQEWKSVRMEPYTINSTKRAGEDRGSLSVKRAKELGYELPTTE